MAFRLAAVTSATSVRVRLQTLHWGARHAAVSMPVRRSRSRDFSLRVFSRSHPYITLVQKNSKETLSTEQPIPVSANTPHENKNPSENEYDWIQDFHYCGDDVDWRDQLCKRTVPALGDSRSGFVSGAISRQGCIERLRADASRQSGSGAPWRRGSLVRAQQGLWGHAWRCSTSPRSAPAAVSFWR